MNTGRVDVSDLEDHVLYVEAGAVGRGGWPLAGALRPALLRPLPTLPPSVYSLALHIS